MECKLQTKKTKTIENRMNATLIYIDWHLLTLIYIDLHLFPLIYIDLHWFTLIYIDLHWFIFIYIDLHWFTSIHIDQHWLTLTFIYIDLHWFGFIYHCSFIYQDMIWTAKKEFDPPIDITKVFKYYIKKWDNNNIKVTIFNICFCYF